MMYRGAFILGRGSARRTGAAGRGFTIVEMVVSVGILGILMVMAGAVFALTLRSSGQASALIEINQSIRAVEQSLREDLRYVQPGSSMMAIQGVRMNAWWTTEDREADNDGQPLTPAGTRRDPEHEVPGSGGSVIELPRADMLMFFTARPGTSYVNPELNAQMQQVVYGHALIGELNPDGTWRGSLLGEGTGSAVAVDGLTFNPSTGQYGFQAVADTSTPLSWAARDWHLARRSVLILDQNVAPPAYYPADDLNDGDIPESTHDTNPTYSNLSMRYHIRDGRRDFVVNGVFNGVTGFDFGVDVVDRIATIGPIAASLDPPLSVPQYDNVLQSDYLSAVNWMSRSQIDVEPPTTQARRLGHYLLPNCASFKVEWALEVGAIRACDDASQYTGWQEPGLHDLLWIDPVNFAATIANLQERAASGDARCIIALRTLRDRLVPAAPTDPLPQGQDPDRFIDTSEAPNNIRVLPVHFFYPRRPYPAGYPNPADVPDPLFPKALRITIDVFDRAGRLERPIRHVMVIPVGGA